MIAFHFPPFGQSSGRLRTLGFARHLGEYGWQPAVVTARSAVYPMVQPESLAEIPPTLPVTRAAGVDISRLVSIRGVYPRWLATPDRWCMWAIGALSAGLSIVKRSRPDVIWTTFPIPSAVLAGVLLSRLTGVPLVVDLRDPMVYEGWPANAWQRAVYGRLERWAVSAAQAVVVTTPGACRMYRERYPRFPAERFQVIQNGVEDDYERVGMQSSASAATSGPIVLVHSGLMEHPDRDPSALFAAIGAVRRAKALPARGLRVILRATGRNDYIRRMAAQAGVEDLVVVEPHIAREAAVREMSSAHGLILFQGQACNRQIPAKAYEYLAARRPILALVHPDGDTHDLMANQWNVPYTADMACPSAIETLLRRFFEDVQNARAFVPSAALIEPYSRRARSRELSTLLDSIAAAH